MSYKRPLAISSKGARWARRARATAISNTPASALLTDDFRVEVREWAREIGAPISGIFPYATQYNRGLHWMRERYYGGVEVRQEDLDLLRSMRRGGRQSVDTIADEIRIYRKAVEEMCRVCAGVEYNEPASCWDRTCPLRPISPLPLGIQRPDALTADDV